MTVEALAELVRGVAAREIMPRFRNLSGADVRTKSGPHDPVTVADEAAEAALSAALRERYPGCTVVGEEAASADPSLLRAIAEAPLCFIVDPIDGTANYAAGLPLFGVMLAVVEHGRTTAAVIHDPVVDDSALAVAGQGAWSRRGDGGGGPLRVSAPEPIERMGGNVSWRYMPEPRRSQVCARMPRLGAVADHRCAAHQYRMLAAGHVQFAVYNRLLPWDHAAGVLLHREAGGYSARLDGSGYDPAETDGGLICAPDRASWDVVYRALFAPE